MSEEQKNVYLRFRHGLGDCAQFTIVLKHIKKYKPHWSVDVAASKGRLSCFNGLCNDAYLLGREHKRNYDKTIDVQWNEAGFQKQGFPASKVTKSLIEEFDIEPDKSLYKYTINVQSNAKKNARKYISELPEPNKVVIIHNHGKTSTQMKDVDNSIIRELCRKLVWCDCTPVVLDWDNHCKFTNNQTIFSPGSGHWLWDGRQGDAGTITALIQQSKLFIGIDSGPLHLAGATETPSLGLWTSHYPSHFYDLCPNVKHLVPRDARRHIRSMEWQKVQRHFENAYRHSYYGSLKDCLFKEVEKCLSIKLPKGDKKSTMNQLLKNGRWWGISSDPHQPSTFH